VLRKGALRAAQQALLVAIIIIAIVTAYLSLRVLLAPWHALPATPPATPSPTPAPTPTATATPEPTPTEPPPTPTITPVPAKRVGIVAGHWGYDSGAVCPDGLTEVEINLSIARLVVALLEERGYEVDLLKEFDPTLEGYQADALVSIHADSCDVPEASGFKVARVICSAVPEEEDRLVECLRREYQRATGLFFHKNSITYDMREYHAFYEIAPQTPGAIIETGFMAADRELLTEHQDVVAQGIAQGIICFLEGGPD